MDSKKNIPNSDLFNMLTLTSLVITLKPSGLLIIIFFFISFCIFRKKIIIDKKIIILPFFFFNLLVCKKHYYLKLPKSNFKIYLHKNTMVQR